MGGFVTWIKTIRTRLELLITLIHVSSLVAIKRLITTQIYIKKYNLKMLIKLLRHVQSKYTPDIC